MAKVERGTSRESKTLNPISLHPKNEGEDSGESPRFPFLSKGCPKPGAEDQTGEESESKRKHLADLLWGHGSVQKRDSKEIKPVRLEESASTSGEVRRLPGASFEEILGRRTTQRRQCSFPGLLRILLPEISFQPKVLAVRMVDVSPRGAKLETRQLTTALTESLTLEDRYARLEALVPSGKQILPGRVVWTDLKDDLSFLGMRFEQEFENVDELFARDLDQTKADTHPLISPRLHPFPSMTSKSEFTFRGIAPGAKEVEASNGERFWRALVENDVFELKLPIAPETSNFISFTGLHERVRSIPTPICIIHRAGVRDTHSFNAGGLVQDLHVDEETQRLSIELAGGPRRFFQAFRVMEKMLQHADHLELRMEITGNVKKAEKILRTLQDDKP